MNWRRVVISDQDLSFYAKGLALYLNTFMNDSHNMAFPSLRRIESEMSVSKKTIIKYLSELTDAGYLQKGQILCPTTTQFHNTYTALIPDSKNPLKGGVPRTPPSDTEVVYLRDEGGVSQGTKVVYHVHPNNQLNNQGNKQVIKTATFVAPSLVEIQDYQEEKALNLDPSQFHDFYESKGWIVGRVKMKDWKAAARGWSARETKNENHRHSKSESNHARVMRELQEDIGKP